MAYLLGVDIGTGGARALLIQEDGAPVASATSEYPLYQPRPQWAEQEPEDWWTGAVQAVRQVMARAGADPAEVRALGLSGQMHGVVLLDGQNHVLRRSIIWADQRSQAQCDWITERIGAKRLVERTSNPALTGFSAPKLLWIRDNEPEIFERARKFLLPKDFIRLRLTGEYATEVSDASGTSLFDVQGRDWAWDVVDDLGLDRDLLPRAFESPEVSGRLTAAAAQETGLPPGLPVVGGGGDQAAGAVGNGIVETGIVSSTIGTSGVVFAFTDEPRRDDRGRLQTFCHAVPGKWHVMGVTQGAGLSLRWFRDNFGECEVAAARWLDTDPYDLLAREAEQAPLGCEGLLWLPYLMGERAPVLDPEARGVLFGITARHDRAMVVRAIMEGVTYSLRDSLDIMRKEMQVPVRQIRASGGGARSSLWRQMQADVFGVETVALHVAEGPAYGVALLAAVGAGLYGSVAEACRETLRVTEVLNPVPEHSRAYESFYGIYTSLYSALKDKFHAMASLVQ
ncbi:MAG: xylulokinase [Anaerolineae bacterium]|nr:xylulokinase [Anaerolineae bacterium]